MALKLEFASEFTESSAKPRGLGSTPRASLKVYILNEFQVMLNSFRDQIFREVKVKLKGKKRGEGGREGGGGEGEGGGGWGGTGEKEEGHS